MKKSTLYFLITIFALLTSCNKKVPVSLQIVKAEAPFEMPEISFPDFSKCATFPITEYGAVQENQEKTSEAIAKAIDAAHQAGGGSVIVPEGVWQTGSIHLKSNVNLYITKGALLLFSDNPNDYLPAVHSTWEGMECYNYSPLIYAYKCKNIAITGEGELKAKMELWKTWFPRTRPHMNSLKRLYEMASTGVPVNERVMVNDTSHLRPHFIQFNRSENVLLEGVSITNSPFWTIHPYLSKNVVLRNLNVFAHGNNSDGVDPEMTQNMLIEDCTFNQGDDAIAVKSGRNQDAWRLNTPTKNLVIRNCFVKNGHQLLAIGSEMSGGVENIFMDNCTVEDGANMFHLLFLKTNERRGGFIKNIYVSNLKGDIMQEGILGIETDVLYQWRDLVPTYERRISEISDIYLENIHANNVKFITRIFGQEELPVKRVNLKNVLADSIREQRNINYNVIDFSEE